MVDTTSMLALLGLAYTTVFLVNLAPAFMPPTWLVLAFFIVRFGLPLWPLALGGALAASAGRLCLALASRRWGRALLTGRQRASLTVLGRWIEERARWAAPLAVLVYSFGPVPSNQLFMAAGLTGMRLAPIVVAFLAGRMLSYPLWASLAHVAAHTFSGLFLEKWGSPGAVGLEILTLVGLALLTRVPWPRVLRMADQGSPAE